MKHRYAIVIALLACASAVFPAAAQTPGAAEPVPPTTITTPLQQIGLEHAGDCLLDYQNTTPTPAYYWVLGPGAYTYDDLHMTNAGPVELCAFDFGYYSPSGPTDATIVFVDNDGSDNVPTVIVAGPFLVPGLPAGINGFHIEAPGGTLGPSVWMGVRFSNTSAGPLMSDPPTVGSSHNVAYTEGYGHVADPVVATNLWMAVYASPAVQTEAATWGRVKAIHR